MVEPTHIGLQPDFREQLWHCSPAFSPYPASGGEMPSFPSMFDPQMPPHWFQLLDGWCFSLSQSRPSRQHPSLLGWQHCSSLARGRLCISFAPGCLGSGDLILYQIYSNQFSAPPGPVVGPCPGHWGVRKMGIAFPKRKVALLFLWPLPWFRPMYLSPRTGSIVCRTQCIVKMQGPLFNSF